MSLTTPVTRDEDSAFPGENWFFYWKTSASLWEEKIRTGTGSGKVILPINWSFHSDTGDKIDFGTLRPETDLKKLVKTIESVGKEAVFFLPISPAPFLSNGGLPSLLARTLAIGENDIVTSVVDNNEGINKVFSHYDPRIFKAYSRFCKSLGKYISESGISSDVWGVDCGYIHNGKFIRYINDSSRAFESSFTRFIEAKKSEEDSLIEEVVTPDVEKILKSEFSQTIDELYLDIASKGIGANWEGKLRVSLLGGSQQDFFNRLDGNGSSSYYSSHLFHSVEREIIPSTVLLNHIEKKSLLRRQFQEVVVDSFLPKIFRGGSFSDGIGSFKPLTFFAFSEGSNGNFWQRLGVLSHLYQNYRHCHILKDGVNFNFDEEDDQEEVIHFYAGEDLYKEDFQKILKYFLHGGKIILEKSTLEESLGRRLESFILENSLEVEKVKLNQTNVENITLGEGRLVLFEQGDLGRQSLDKLNSFWESILSTFEVSHISVSAPEGVDFSWRKRDSLSGELSYEEVRRLSLYNTSSYKKKVKLSFEKNFALSKVIDELNAKVETSPHSCEVELLPDGAVSFDFGVFTL